MTHDSQAEEFNFLQTIIEDDLESGRCSKVVVRFPPEPNGYLHIGHAKSTTLNFGLAARYGGVCHLRFDDTNPETENIEYVDAIKRDLRWLGFDWGDNEFYASDYFEQLYAWAVQLIEKGKAYVDDLSEDHIRAYRGSVTEPGQESPYRQRSVAENLDLFERMRKGEFPDGVRVLRAKIDMAHPNMKMRDPLMYRIRHTQHYRRGNEWCIYPFYDWAHGQSDAIEGITHSICTLEFTVNRPLYDWYLDALELSPRPYQYEFARLNLAYTITSKRKLLQLVQEKMVRGWDDPRMPTLSGIRRRGITPGAIRKFCVTVGTTKVDSISELGVLEHIVRQDLNHTAPRVMCVLRPLKVTLTNYPVDMREMLIAPYWPHDIGHEGVRKVPFSRELFIERDDFMEEPSRGYRRLSPGSTVRLRYAYIIRCNEVVRDAAGTVVELLCSYYPETKTGNSNGAPKAKSTIHWVDARASLPLEVRLYDHLFNSVDPGEGAVDFREDRNSESLEILRDCRIEPSVAHDTPGGRYQFMRLGYFWQDPKDSSPEALVFNRIVALRDSWRKAGKPEPVSVPESLAPEPATIATGVTVETISFVEGLTREQRQWVETTGASAGISQKDGAYLVKIPGAVAYFEEAAQQAAPLSVVNWMINAIFPAQKEGESLSSLRVGPKELATLITLVNEGSVTTHVAREVFAEMLESGGNPEELVAAKLHATIDNPDVLIPIVNDIFLLHADKVAAYRSGKTGLLGFFIGRVMKATSGRALPHVVKRLIQERL